MKLNRKELADVFGVDESTLRRWADAGMPCEVRGRQGKDWVVDSAEAIAWLLERERSSGDDGEHRKAKTEFLQIQTEYRKEQLIDLRQAREDQARAFLDNLVTEIRARWIQMPAACVARMLHLLPTDEKRWEVHDIIKTVFWEVLQQPKDWKFNEEGRVQDLSEQAGSGAPE